MSSYEPIGAHQTSDTMTTDPLPASAELTEHARRPIGAAGLVMDLADLIEQRRVRDRARRRPPRDFQA